MLGSVALISLQIFGSNYRSNLEGSRSPQVVGVSSNIIKLVPCHRRLPLVMMMTMIVWGSLGSQQARVTKQ